MDPSTQQPTPTSTTKETQTETQSSITPSSSFSSSSSPASSSTKGIVLGPDGKPCKVCTGFKAWTATQSKKAHLSSSTTSSTGKGEVTRTGVSEVDRDRSGLRKDCPADGDRLGRHTWTFLHTTAANYPTTPDPASQRSARALLDALAVLYPCQPCAAHLQSEISRNPPDVSSREKLERWMCETHNEVNRRLGKEEFDCTLVAQRWRDGWNDGRCDD